MPSLPLTSPRHTWNIPKQYEIKEVIGSGHFGDVCKAYDHEKEDAVAIQQVRYAFTNSNIQRGGIMSQKKLTEPFCHSLLRELTVHSQLEHDNLLKLFDVVANPDLQSFDELYLVTECYGTDLGKLLRSDAVLQAVHINAMLYNLLAGLNYVHSAGIVLCELSPANCLVNADYGLKIQGFGSSRALIEGSSYAHNPLHAPRSTAPEGNRHHASRIKRCNAVVADRWYRAPELLLNQERITAAVDLWSTGCIYAELLRMLPGTAIQDRAPLFPGGPDQLRHIFGVLGMPREADLTWLDSDVSRNRFKDYYSASTQGEQLTTNFPEAAADLVAIVDQLLKFVPSTRKSAEEAFSNSLFCDFRQPAKEVVASRKVQFEFTLEPEFPQLDEKLLRKHFSKQLSKFPAPDVLVTLQEQERSADCLVLDCVTLSGESLITFSFPDAQQVTFGELRRILVKHTGGQIRDLKLLLPCGRILVRADDSKSFADICANI